MFIKIKEKIKKWVLEIIREEIKRFVGKKNPEKFDTDSLFSFKLFFGPSIEVEDKGPTGLFRDIEILEKKVKSLEKFLKIEFYEETQEIKKYRPVKAKKKNS